MPVELHETEVDGVRCFWVDARRPTLSAMLTFRQGMADEALTDSGWLHLLEHLCLHGRGGGALHVNGSVSVVSTEFTAHGPTDQVSRHLGEVTGWLARPDLRDLHREREVLRAESRLRTGPAPRAFGWRYGAQGPGLITYDDPGLGRATPELLALRAAEVFTTGNAVLALDGPPPAGLRLGLPPGPYRPAAVAVPCDNGRAAYVEDAGLVLSGVVARSGTATVVPEILRRALKQRLRDQAGGAYAPWADYHRVDSGHALVLAGSDVTPQLLPTLAALTMDLVGRFESEPVPTAWMDEIIAERLQAYDDPHAVAQLAWRAASMALLGDHPENHAELVEQIRGLDPEAVRRDLVDFCDTLLLGIPAETAWQDQLPMLQFPTSTHTPGRRRWRHRNWPANTTVLSLEPDRLAVSEKGTTRSLATAELAGVYCFPDGARHLVTRDGWSLSVEPDRWRNGGQAVREIDTVVPPHLWLPQAPRQDIQKFEPIPLPSRWWRFLRANRAASGVLAALVLALTTAGAFIAENTLPPGDTQGVTVGILLGTGVLTAVGWLTDALFFRRER